MSNIQVGVTTAQQAADIINAKLSPTDFVAGDNISLDFDQTEKTLTIAAVLAGSYTFAEPASAPTVEIDFTGNDIYRITLNQPTTDISVVDSSPVAGKAKQISVILRQGTGANEVNWPLNIRWAAGVPPLLSFTANDDDVVTLVHCGEDNYFYGFFSGDSFRA